MHTYVRSEVEWSTKHSRGCFDFLSPVHFLNLRLQDERNLWKVDCTCQLFFKLMIECLELGQEQFAEHSDVARLQCPVLDWQVIQQAFLDCPGQRKFQAAFKLMTVHQLAAGSCSKACPAGDRGSEVTCRPESAGQHLIYMPKQPGGFMLTYKTWINHCWSDLWTVTSTGSLS